MSLEKCCDADPILVNRVGILTKVELVVYRCNKCGKEDSQLLTNAEMAEKSWNHFLKPYSTPIMRNKKVKV